MTIGTGRLLQAVAVLSSRVPIPGRLTPILKGGLLPNDASGLVCFLYAMAARQGNPSPRPQSA
ncbi:MAG: hypothetical protein J0H50_09720 [Xanthomonadales bacterium]|nr:hypothetical protein [Xanthomonadales bacterium]